MFFSFCLLLDFLQLPLHPTLFEPFTEEGVHAGKNCLSLCSLFALLDPAQFPEPLLEHICDFLCRLIGSPLYFTFTTHFPVCFHSGADDKSSRICGSNEGGRSYSRPRGFVGACIG
jgi:hypothetical protein